MNRILHVVDSMGLGGIQSFIMNLYRSIDKSQYQFDFLLHHKMEHSYEDEIKDLGGYIYYLPARNEGIIKNRKALNSFFREHTEYKVVHQHESSLTYIEPLVAAKKNRVPIRIIHAHSTRASGSYIHTLLHKINKVRIYKIATRYLACGRLAAEWMYSNTSCEDNYVTVNNGINIEEYKYNEEIRQKMRQSFGIADKFVIGNVGRFSKVKNHSFLLDVFKEYSKRDGDSVLVLVGNGELFDDMKIKAVQLGIMDRTLFLGARNDVSSILHMLDYEIIPSLYEGFPVTAVEAQANGIPCIISDTVTTDVVINDNVTMLSLNAGAITWADAISNEVGRVNDTSKLIQYGYDIKTTLANVCSIYGER